MRPRRYEIFASSQKELRAAGRTMQNNINVVTDGVFVEGAGSGEGTYPHHPLQSARAVPQARSVG